MVELSIEKVSDSWKFDFRERLREIYGDNVAKFSRKSGINDRTLRKYIRDKEPAMPGADILAIIQKHSSKSADWLLTDKEQQENCYVECGDKLKILCEKVKKVLNSKTPYAAALESNILCFEDSINIRRELENLKAVQSAGQGGDMPK